MKLFKKLTVLVAMALICFTMMEPLKADAVIIDDGKVPLCNHDNTEKVYADSELIYSGTHEYTYQEDANNNGVPENVHALCFYSVIRVKYDIVCTCGAKVSTWVEYQEIHFDCEK